jgi:hypothetical protein
LAIRELVANALIHQDLSVSGSGPMVEILTTAWRSPIPARQLGGPTVTHLTAKTALPDLGFQQAA